MSEVALNSQVTGFESASELRAEHARLLDALDRQLDEDLGPTEEAAALSRLEPLIRGFLERGAATGVYLDEVKERTACQVLLDYWVSSLAQAAIGAPPARLAAFDGDRLPDLKEKRCPYVGLDAFREREFFFGRESDTQTLLEQIRNTPLVVVLGASGSGKSSLVMGGVLPALGDPQVEPVRRVGAPIVPGTAVLAHLAEALGQLSSVASESATDAEAKLQTNPDYLIAMVGGPHAAPVVITIDQFEEVFTLSGVAQRETLVAAIASLLQSDRGHRVILTMREEFRSRLVELRGLSPFLDRAWYSMRPMGYEELKAAIERPAALVNLQFQSGIVDDLVKKVLGQPAALPLLQFTLRTLWDERDRNRITWEVYDKVGDPLTALKTSADTFYDALTHETQTEARRILLELVRVDALLEAYRQPVPKSRLLQAGKANTEEVLRILTENDYVRVAAERNGEDAIVEVKHESLIRNWPRLVAWIDEKRIERRQRIALTQAADRWGRSGKPAAGLLTGWQLEEAKKQLDLSELEREFVEASAEQLERARRDREEALRRELVRERRQARLIRLGAVVVILILSVLIGLMVYLFRKADSEADAARVALGQASTQEAVRLLEAGKPEEALAHLARTLRSDANSLAARGLISDLLLNQRVLPALNFPHGGEIFTVAFSPDGRRLLTASADNAARVWDTASGQVIGLLQHEYKVNGAAFSADGTLVVTASSDSTARIWSAVTGQLVSTLQHKGFVNSATFSPDGRRLVTASSDGRAQIWDVATGATVGPPLQHEDVSEHNAKLEVLAAVFSSDGQLLVTVANDATARVWSIRADDATRKPLILKHANTVHSAAFSPDGRLVITACADGTARVWSTKDSQSVRILRHDASVSTAAFSGDGRSVITASADGTARLWDSATGLPIGAPLSHSSAVHAAAFSPDGRRVVTASADGTARIWDAETGAPLGLPLHHRGGVTQAAFSGDGRHLITASSDGTAQLWNVVTGEAVAVSQHKGSIKAAAFGRQGRRVVIVSNDTARIVNADTGQSVGALQHNGVIYAAAFSPDERRIVTASGDATARIWDAVTGGPVGAPLRHDRPVNAAAFSSDGNQIVTISADNTARVWDATTGAAVSVPFQHQGVFAAAFSDDGRRVITASSDNTTRVWNVGTGQAIGESVEYPGSIKALTFNGEVPRVAIVSGIPVQVWDAALGQGTRLQNREVVDKAAFSPDARLIVTASRHTVRVWDVASGQPVGGTLLHAGTVDEVAFSVDGHRIVVTTSDGASHIWPVLPNLRSSENVQDLADLAEIVGRYHVTASSALVPLGESDLLQRVRRLVGTDATAVDPEEILRRLVDER
jgi:WD40 repeat protein